jgi:hypothetical protein
MIANPFGLNSSNCGGLVFGDIWLVNWNHFYINRAQDISCEERVSDEYDTNTLNLNRMSLPRYGDFQSIRTRDLSWLDISGTPPAAGSLMTIGMNPYLPDRASWTRDPSLNSVSLVGGGTLTYSGGLLRINGTPVSNKEITYFFTTPLTSTITVASSPAVWRVEYTIVGGGGGGGGGAGGSLLLGIPIGGLGGTGGSTSTPVSGLSYCLAGQVISYTVGAGGTQGTAGQNTPSGGAGNGGGTGGNGGASSITILGGALSSAGGSGGAGGTDGNYSGPTAGATGSTVLNIAGGAGGAAGSGVGSSGGTGIDGAYSSGGGGGGGGLGPYYGGYGANGGSGFIHLILTAVV